MCSHRLPRLSASNGQVNMWLLRLYFLNSFFFHYLALCFLSLMIYYVSTKAAGRDKKGTIQPARARAVLLAMPLEISEKRGEVT